MTPYTVILGVVVPDGLRAFQTAINMERSLPACENRTYLLYINALLSAGREACAPYIFAFVPHGNMDSSAP